MSIVARRMVFFFGSLFLLATISLVAASIVEYKPWGVHDLQGDEYDRIIARIDEQAILRESPRPIFKLISVENPKGLLQPGTKVETVAVLGNGGDRPLVCYAPPSWPVKLTPMNEYPVQIEPGKEATLRFEWEVPDQQDELDGLQFSIKSNDPLHESNDIEPFCEVAKTFFLANPSIDVAEGETQSIHSVNYVFSQRFDDFLIVDTKADDRLVVDLEPVVDPALLSQYQAKSGVQISVTDPPGRRRGTYILPIEFTASNDTYSEKLSFDFALRRRSSTTFFGPELDVRAGLYMGVIEVGSESHWTFFARLASEKPASDVKLEVQPDIFDAEFALARKGSRDYRITLRLKKDAIPTDFQAASKGYVKLSSEEDPSIDNGIPIRGVVINPLGDE